MSVPLCGCCEKGRQPLPPLPGGAFVGGASAGGASAGAYDNNDRGQIAGTGHTAEGPFHTVLWTPGAGTPASQIEGLIARVEDLVESGELEEQNASPLLAKLHAAHQALLDGKPTTTLRGQLGALINQVNALVLSRRLSDGPRGARGGRDASPLSENGHPLPAG